MKYLIRGAHLVDPSTSLDKVADIAVKAGRIAAVGQNLDSVGFKVFDAGGLHLFPGLIDVHVHLREPGQEYKEDIRSGTRAAAAGGFTGVAAMPNTVPVNDNAEITSYILEKARAGGVCRVYPVGAISKGLKGEDLAHIGEMKEAGIVAVTDDGRPVESAMLMRRAMEYASHFNLPVISHSEDLSLAHGGAMHEGAVSTTLGLPGIPAEAEEIMVARDILLAKLTGAKLHLAHLSTAGSMSLLYLAKSQRLKVTGETAPHYFTFTDEKVKSFDSVYKMNPPLREARDVKAVRDALRSGVVDMIATDHAPHAADEKEREFEAAPNGVIGLETSLGLALGLVHEGIISLLDLVRLMSTAPAKTLGLPGGTLAAGAAADFTLVDLNASWTVDSSRFQSKSRNCPFHGMELKGRAVKTITAGKLVYDNGTITADNLEKAEYPI